MEHWDLWTASWMPWEHKSRKQLPDVLNKHMLMVEKSSGNKAWSTETSEVFRECLQRTLELASICCAAHIYLNGGKEFREQNMEHWELWSVSRMSWDPTTRKQWPGVLHTYIFMMHKNIDNKTWNTQSSEVFRECLESTLQESDYLECCTYIS